MHCVRACIIKAKRKECVNLDDIICIKGDILDDKRFFVLRNEKLFIFSKIKTMGRRLAVMATHYTQ